MSMALRAPRKERLQPVSPRGGETQEDGSLVVTAEQLARFGQGDAARGRRELRSLLSAEHTHELTEETDLPPSLLIADERHEELLRDLWLLDLRENAAHVAPIDEEMVLDNVRHVTRRRGIGIIGYIPDYDGLPIAMVVLHGQRWHWSKGWFYQEMVSFVHPDHRASRHGDDLSRFVKWWAEQQSKKAGYTIYVLCGVLGTYRIHTKTAFYRKSFPQVGSAFLWPPPVRRGN